MPAPSAAALRDFETQLDTLLVDLLSPFADAPYSCQLVGHGSILALETPRLEYEVSMTEPVGPGGSNLIRPDTGAQTAFAANIALRHVYDHMKTPATTLGAFRGALRTRFSPETLAISVTNLPYLAPSSLTELSSARARFTEANTDHQLSEWVSVWLFQFVIRESAWPNA